MASSTKASAPVPRCCLGPSTRCGWTGERRCRCATDCRTYYAPCARHAAMPPAERRADYERLREAS